MWRGFHTHNVVSGSIMWSSVYSSGVRQGFIFIFIGWVQPSMVGLFRVPSGAVKLGWARFGIKF